MRLLLLSNDVKVVLFIESWEKSWMITGIRRVGLNEHLTQEQEVLLVPFCLSMRINSI